MVFERLLTILSKKEKSFKMEYNLRKEEKFCLFTPLEKNLNRAISADLKAEFVFLQNEGVKNLIIDLSQVEFIDSDGLSALLMARRNFTEQNGSFVITGDIQPNVTTMFKISKLSEVLNIIVAEEEAIEFVFMEELEREINSDAPSE